MYYIDPLTPHVAQIPPFEARKFTKEEDGWNLVLKLNDHLQSYTTRGARNLRF